MSDDHAFELGKFIPGFDFLQKLATGQSGAHAPAPELGNWVAPTVSVDELERRIKDLKAVQFWLDQNAVAIKATIQALEVQKMTLATLQGMNFNMAEVAKVFTLPTGDAAAPAAAGAPRTAWPYAGAPAKPAAEPVAAGAPSPAEPPPPAPAKKPAKRPRTKPVRKPAAKAAAPKSAAGPADPMQWWNALTQQFQQIAANALREAEHAAPTGADATSTQAATNSKATRAASSKGAEKSAARKKARP